MKNISELINSLFSTPADATGITQIKNPLSTKGFQPNGSNFGDVLAQVATQNGAASNQGGNAPANAPVTSSNLSNGVNNPGTVSAPSNAGSTSGNPAPGNGNETLVSVSETTVAITESVKVDNLNELAQAEQTLASMAMGLSRLLNLLSGLPGMNQTQAQNALAASGLGQVNPAEVQSLLNDLQALIQKVPASQNALLLPSDQQNALLSQLLQQMIAGQQILLGGSGTQAASGTPAGNTGISAANGSGTIPTQDVTLKMLFSNMSALETQQTNTQSSQVFIDLQTFKMSATFIQEGSSNNQGGTGIAGASFQPLSTTNSPSLLAALNQALQLPSAITQAATTGSPTLLSQQSQGALSQNLRDLVQLLLQSGASQAALTQFMKQQANLTPAANVTEAQNQAIPQGNSIQALNQAAEVPPVQAVAPTISSAATLTTNQAPPSIQQANEPSPQAINNLIAQMNALAVQTTETSLQTANNFIAQMNALAAQATQNPAPSGVKPNVPVEQVIAALQQFQPSTAVLGGNNPLPVSANAVKPTLASTNLSQLLNNPAGNPQVPGNETVTQAAFASFTESVVTNNSQGVLTTALPPVSIPPAPANLNISNVITGLTQDQVLPNDSAAAAGVPNQALITPVSVDSILGAANQLVNPSNAPTLLRAAVQPAAPVNPAVNTASVNATVAPTTVSNTASLNSPIIPVNITVLAQEQLNQVAQGNLTPATTVPNSTQNPTPSSVVAALTTNTSVVPTVGSVPQPPAVSNTPVGPAIVPPQSVTTPAANVSNPVNFQVQPTTGTPIVNQATTPANPPAAVPLPVSSAPLIPASAVAGEAVKTEIPTQLGVRNDTVNNSIASANPQSPSAVIPIAPEAVAPVGSVTSTDAGLKTLNIVDKNAPNDSAVLQANALLTAANATPDKSSASAMVNTPVASNALPTGSIDSAQIINQISQQVAAQTAEAKTISHLNFQLVPESLGRVTVQIALVDQSVSARILVANPEVRETLQTHMVDLKTALNQAGLQIDQLQVQVQGGGGNLLAQYYQYQQEGFGYRSPVSPMPLDASGAQNAENTGDLGALSVRTSLVDVLA